MASLKSMASNRFKTKRGKSKVMPNKRRTKRRTSTRRSPTRRRSSRSSSSNGNGAFSGKVLGFKIPIIGDALRNKTVQKALAATGLVTTVLTVASLINNPTVNRVASNEFVQLGLAGAAGDITGVATQLIRTRGLPMARSRMNGGQAQAQGSLVPMAGGGVA